MAAGGQGAPLVPMTDFCMFRHATKNRLLLNLGGIANVTVLPAGCGVDDVMAFDTGPGNTWWIDACMEKVIPGDAFDRGGAMAVRGMQSYRVSVLREDDDADKVFLFSAAEELRS